MKINNLIKGLQGALMFGAVYAIAEYIKKNPNQFEKTDFSKVVKDFFATNGQCLKRIGEAVTFSMPKNGELDDILAALADIIGILAIRVRSLPQDDKEDFCKLIQSIPDIAQSIPSAKIYEEIDSIFNAMFEILEQKPDCVLKMF
jgi:hypothetical protein